VRYRVGKLEVRSENAAKPGSQASAPLVDWLEKRDRFGRVLDYGCGKLRYARVLAENCRSLTLVDSAVQLDREQIIFGERTTVRRYAEKWRHTSVISVEDFPHRKLSFDFVLCSNVLSAIPSRDARDAALELIRTKLSRNGRALFVVQFRNSFYRDLRKRKAVSRYLDGYLYRTPRGTFYYGIIPPDKLEKLVRAARFKVERSWIEGESALVLARR
jgi:SAM-dependent methyltransferase